MQRFFSAVLLLLMAVGTACTSRNPAAGSDAGTGYGDRKPGGGQPSPDTGSGGGNQPTPVVQSGRHTLTWDGSVLRLRLAGPVFSAWKDGGGETTVDLNHGWSSQYVPFNATDGRKNGLEMKREGNDLFQFQAMLSDKFSVKFIGPSGNAWVKYETTDLSGVEKELDAGSSTSYHFKIAQPGII